MIKILLAGLLTSTLGIVLYQYLFPDEVIDLRLKLIEELKKYDPSSSLCSMSQIDQELHNNYHRQLIALNHLQKAYEDKALELKEYIKNYGLAKTVGELSALIENYPYR